MEGTMNTTLSAPIITLIGEQSDKLARFYRSSGVPYADAQDLVQQTFQVFMEKSSQGAIEQPRSFLWGIARKKLLQYRDRLRHHAEFRSSQILPQGITSPSQRLDRRLRVQLLLQRLGDEERTAFLMRCEGLTLPAIAEAMDLSLATIKRRLSEARKHIETISAEPGTAGGEDDRLSIDEIEDSIRSD